jgi:hypothetical protein
MIYDFCSFCLNNLNPSKKTVPSMAGTIRFTTQIPADAANTDSCWVVTKPNNSRLSLPLIPNSANAIVGIMAIIINKTAIKHNNICQLATTPNIFKNNICSFISRLHIPFIDVLDEFLRGCRCDRLSLHQVLYPGSVLETLLFTVSDEWVARLERGVLVSERAERAGQHVHHALVQVLQVLDRHAESGSVVLHNLVGLHTRDVHHRRVNQTFWLLAIYVNLVLDNAEYALLRYWVVQNRRYKVKLYDSGINFVSRL